MPKPSFPSFVPSSLCVKFLPSSFSIDDDAILKTGSPSKFYSVPILRYKQRRMEETEIHFYNVITGKCACGAGVDPSRKTFSVFVDKVSCAQCLAALKAKEGKSEGKSG